jgi:cytochrome c biogenesis protein CcmG/thiol:disulfide interchange protein DsbE
MRWAATERTGPRALGVAATAAVALLLAGCGGGTGSDANDAVAPTPTPPAETASAEPSAWQTAEITDVSGATFSLADLVGKPVFVEFFATWCSSCLAQLGDTQAAAAELGDEAAFVVLSVETDLGPGDVAAYAERHGFDNLRFAVMTPELLAATVSSLGNSVASPPSTPHLVIDANGVAGDLATGFASASEIVSSIRSPAPAG